MECHKMLQGSYESEYPQEWTEHDWKKTATSPH